MKYLWLAFMWLMVLAVTVVGVYVCVYGWQVALGYSIGSQVPFFISNVLIDLSLGALVVLLWILGYENQRVHTDKGF